jgi:hypothetical protein
VDEMAYKSLEKRRQYRKKYYILHREEMLKKAKAFGDKHRDVILERAKRYREKNRVAINGRRRKHTAEHPEEGKQRYREHIVECKKYAKKYYWLNRNYILSRTKERESLLRKEVLDYYGGSKCACCGESTIEFLSIDHINGGGNKHRKEIGKGRRIYRWLKFNHYPTGFQVLCMNCNHAKGSYGICPHQEKK